MPALSFKKQFAQPIRRRTKNHTIRAKRKRPIKPGDKLYLFTGMRTKHCRRILKRPVICTKVEEIKIFQKKGGFGVAIDGPELDDSEKEQLARCDGFKDFSDMMKFWKGRLPFYGDIIHWRHQ